MSLIEKGFGDADYGKGKAREIKPPAIEDIHFMDDMAQDGVSDNIKVDKFNPEPDYSPDILDNNGDSGR